MKKERRWRRNRYECTGRTVSYHEAYWSTTITTVELLLIYYV